MFKEMRRKDRELSMGDSIKLLENGEYGILSTIGGNGFCYGIPLSYAYINNCIYFHCAKEGNKLDNINVNNRVSFCVVGRTRVLPEQFSTEYESAVVFGTAWEVEDLEKKDALMALVEKYSPGYSKEGMDYINRSGAITKVVKIKIERVTGKSR